jgi:DNA repair protein RecO
MSPVKTTAVVVKVLAYRESSYIAYLFTDTLGLIHGIAKGIRKPSRSQQLLERGFIIECNAYVRPHRELHTLGAVQVREYFGATRTSLVKTALRDATFELVCAAVTVADPHPAFFRFLVRFLAGLEEGKEDDVCPFSLWTFYYRFASMMGVAPDLDKCVYCGGKLEGRRISLCVGDGGFACAECPAGRTAAAAVHSCVREYLGGNVGVGEVRRSTGPAERKRFTRALADFCRYHCDVRSELKALEFLEGLMEGKGGWKTGG